MLVQSSLQLFISNLKLLNYDVKDLNQVFRTQVDDLDQGIFLKSNNQKLLIHVVHFLMSKICQDHQEEFETHFRIYYPPRTLQEQIDYKKQFIDYLRKLERTGRVPKNFNYCKAILDEKQGIRQIKFLRFLSEFALRHQFIAQFPKKQLKTFYPNPDQRSHYNDLADMFNPASFQLEGLSGIQLERSQVKSETLQAMIGSLQNAIKTELFKLNQIYLTNIDYISKVKRVVSYVEEKDSQIRAQLQDAEEKAKYLKTQLPKNEITQERQLDRIPLIDLNINILQNVHSLVSQYRSLKIDQQIQRFNLDMESSDQLNKLSKYTFTNEPVDYIDVNKIYERVENELTEGIKGVQSFQQKPWLLQQSKKLKEDSKTTLDNLKQFRDKKKQLQL